MNQEEALKILKAGRNVYLTGPAGSGKTHTINQYINYLKDRGVGVALTASTGIAATHIGGVTIHSWSGLGIRDYLTEYDMDELSQKEYLAKRYNNTKVLIIDEVSMLSNKMLDSIERLARYMKGNEEPFGGMQVILSGDLFQLPPITKSEEVTSFMHQSEAWKNGDIRTCYLAGQFRQDDLDLESILAEIRSGEVSEQSFELLQNRIDKKPETNITKLFTHNRDVDALNDIELNKLSGEIFKYEMESKGRKNLVENIKKGLLSPETLMLKKNALVMFTKNNFEEGYVNGTLGTVVDFNNNRPVVETYDGSQITVDLAEWGIEDNGKVIAQVKQYPLRLAWAITVHKSQGMNLDAAEIDLSEAFVAGQGYVALSRLRNLEGLFLKGINNTALQVNPYILEFDIHLKKESEKWRKVIARFSEKEVQEMHDEFVINSGGTLDKEKIKANREKEKSFVAKTPTHKITLTLIQKGHKIKEVAKIRDLTIGTIISHLEKLKEDGESVDFPNIKPKKKDFDTIEKAFRKSKDYKLSPVHKELKGVYDFETLRLVRLFLDSGV